MLITIQDRRLPICLFLLASFSCTESSARRETVHATLNSTASELLDQLLDEYDIRIRPNFNGPPTLVECDMYIYSGFDSVTETTMDYGATFFMRQRWNDPRLSFNGTTTIALNNKLLDKIWVPDLYFINEKDGKFHSITVDNKLLRISPNGDVLYSMRLTLTLACYMNLQNYPMDLQICEMLLESYGYTTEHVIFAWASDKAVSLNKDLNLPQFEIIKVEVHSQVNPYSTGNYTLLVVQFTLRRLMAFYILQTYIPSILLVVLSWVSFWISADAAPARVGLGITTVLTMTTQSSGILSSLPRVSYIKAIDVWMTTCLVFVFGALLEFAAVNFLVTEAKASEKRRKKEEKIKGERQYTVHPQETNQTTLCEDKSESPCVGILKACLGGPQFNQSKYLKPKNRQGWTIQAEKIDGLARIAFPLSFVLFNAVYWPTYLMNR
ncbi:glycine receptor subunit alpha-2-like [Glandiceps talaboti]